MPARVIVIVGQKGGPGKTTTTMNLAAAAAESGARVLVVDVDPQRSATYYAEQAGEGLPFSFAEADLGDTDSLSQLSALDFDYLFVDTPGSLMESEANQALMPTADFAIVPFWGDPLGLPPFVNTVQRVLVPANTPFKVLLNKVNSGRGTDWINTIRRQLTDSDFSVFTAHITDYVHLTDAPAEGKVVTQLTGERPSRSLKAYRRVFQEMQDALGEGSR